AGCPGGGGGWGAGGGAPGVGGGGARAPPLLVGFGDLRRRHLLHAHTVMARRTARGMVSGPAADRATRLRRAMNRGLYAPPMGVGLRDAAAGWLGLCRGLKVAS